MYVTPGLLVGGRIGLSIVSNMHCDVGGSQREEAIYGG